MNPNDLRVGEKYLIAYKGQYDYDGYIGMATYTGKEDDIDGKVYGFAFEEIYTVDDPAWFPIEDVYEVKYEEETRER
jgi:hypothetical protein